MVYCISSSPLAILSSAVLRSHRPPRVQLQKPPPSRVRHWFVFAARGTAEVIAVTSPPLVRLRRSRSVEAIPVASLSSSLVRLHRESLHWV